MFLESTVGKKKIKNREERKCFLLSTVSFIDLEAAEFSNCSGKKFMVSFFVCLIVYKGVCRTEWTQTLLCCDWLSECFYFLLLPQTVGDTVLQEEVRFAVSQILYSISDVRKFLPGFITWAIPHLSWCMIFTMNSRQVAESSSDLCIVLCIFFTCSIPGFFLGGIVWCCHLKSS